MVIVLFRSKLTANAGSAYADTLAEMEEYVKTRPGFIAAKGFTAEDGERLTVVWWQDKETLAAWQHDMRHLEVKQAGRQNWYEYYKMEVAEVYRQSDFAREPASKAQKEAATGD